MTPEDVVPLWVPLIKKHSFLLHLIHELCCKVEGFFGIEKLCLYWNIRKARNIRRKIGILNSSATQKAFITFKQKKMKTIFQDTPFRSSSAEFMQCKYAYVWKRTYSHCFPNIFGHGICFSLYIYSETKMKSSCTQYRKLPTFTSKVKKTKSIKYLRQC